MRIMIRKSGSAAEAGRLTSALPFEGLRRSLAPAASSPPRQPPLMGSVALQSFTMQRGIRLFGLPDPAPAFLVSEPPPRYSTRCRPPWLSQWVHPPVRLTSLQSLSSHRPPGRAEHLPWASVPLRDTNLRSLLTRASRARFVPSPAFLTPSTAFSSAGLAGLFHPAATSRVRSSGSSPREKPYGLVARRCPPVVCTAPLPLAEVLSNAIGSRSRCPPSGLFSTRESVANSSGLDHRTLDPLLSFPSSGPSSHAERTTFITLSDHGLLRPSSCCQRAT